jgi:predicted RNA-binding Zn-ribbon protein involved in translation (DUF1610 family)
MAEIPTRMMGRRAPSKEGESWGYETPMLMLELDKFGPRQDIAARAPLPDTIAELKNKIDEIRLRRELRLEEKKLEEVENNTSPSEESTGGIASGAVELMKAQGEFIKGAGEFVRTQSEILKEQVASKETKSTSTDQEANKTAAQILGEIAKKVVEKPVEKEGSVLATVASTAVGTLGELAKSGGKTDTSLLEKYVDAKFENYMSRIMSEIQELKNNKPKGIFDELKELKELGLIQIGAGDPIKALEIQKELLRMRKELRDSDRKWEYLMQKAAWDRRKEILEMKSKMKKNKDMGKAFEKIFDAAVDALGEIGSREGGITEVKGMTDIKSLKCSSCGTIIRYTDQSTGLVCPGCGAEYERRPEKAAERKTEETKATS